MQTEIKRFEEMLRREKVKELKREEKQFSYRRCLAEVCMIGDKITYLFIFLGQSLLRHGPLHHPPGPAAGGADVPQSRESGGGDYQRVTENIFI